MPYVFLPSHREGKIAFNSNYINRTFFNRPKRCGFSIHCFVRTVVFILSASPSRQLLICQSIRFNTIYHVVASIPPFNRVRQQKSLRQASNMDAYQRHDIIACLTNEHNTEPSEIDKTHTATHTPHRPPRHRSTFRSNSNFISN